MPQIRKCMHAKYLRMGTNFYKAELYDLIKKTPQGPQAHDCYNRLYKVVSVIVKLLLWSTIVVSKPLMDTVPSKK